MITVVERWFLTAEAADRALEVMQEMDELVGPPAHRDPGWCGHARFLQSQQRPGEVLMVYPWRSRAMHEELRRAEEPGLRTLYARSCTRPREIEYYDELPVDVEHDDGAVGP